MEATAGAVRGAAAEQARVEGSLGEREFDTSAVATEAGIGAIVGGGIGGAVGRATGKRQLKALNLIEKANKAKTNRAVKSTEAVKASISESNIELKVPTVGKNKKPTTKTVKISANEQEKAFTGIFNHVRKTFGDEALDAKQVKDGLKNLDKRLLDTDVKNPEKALKETLQYKLAGLTTDIIKKAMVTEDINGEAILSKFELDLSKDRVTTVISKVLRGIDDEELKSTFISDLLQKYDLSLNEFTNLYMTELSNAGRILGLQSAIVKNVAEAFESISDVAVSRTVVDPTDATKTIKQVEAVSLSEEAEKFISAMKQGNNFVEFTKRLKNGVFSNVAEFDRFTKGMMTIQPATTMRNLENATVRGFTYFLQIY